MQCLKVVARGAPFPFPWVWTLGMGGTLESVAVPSGFVEAFVFRPWYVEIQLEVLPCFKNW